MSRKSASIVSLAAQMLLSPAAYAQTQAAISQSFTPANARVCFTHLLAQANQMTPPAKKVTLPNGIVVELPVADKYNYTNSAKGYWCSGSTAHSFTFGLIDKSEQAIIWPTLFLVDIKPLSPAKPLDTQITFVDKQSRLINILLQNDIAVDLSGVDIRPKDSVKVMDAFKSAFPDDMRIINEWRAVAGNLRSYAAQHPPAPANKGCALKAQKAKPPYPCQ